jgi:hypothetical protein
MKGQPRDRRCHRRLNRHTPSLDCLEPRFLLSQGPAGSKPPPPPPPPPADPAIAFVAKSGTAGKYNYDLMVMNADGTNQTAIWRAASGYHLDFPVWSPDLDPSTSGYQGTIAIAVVKNDYSYFALDLVDVGIVNGVPVAQHAYQADDSTDPNVPPDVLDYPSWSPDLNPSSAGYQGKLTFSTYASINTIDVWYTGSGTGNWIGFQTPSVQLPIVRSPGYQFDDTTYAVWSPDLDSNTPGYQGDLAYSRRLRVDNTMPAQYTIEAITATADTSGNVTYGTSPTTLVPPNQYPLDYDLDWSRGGTRIAYYAEGNRGFDWIFTVDLANSNAITRVDALGDASSRSPSWSSDDLSTSGVDESDRYLVVQSLAGSNSTIRRVDLVTGAVITLASQKGADYLWPDFRPYPTGTPPHQPATALASKPAQPIGATSIVRTTAGARALGRDATLLAALPEEGLSPGLVLEGGQFTVPRRRHH